MIIKREWVIENGKKEKLTVVNKIHASKSPRSFFLRTAERERHNDAQSAGRICQL